MIDAVTMFSDLLRRDRERYSLTVEQAAWRLGVPTAAYGKLEAGERWPNWETSDRIAAVTLQGSDLRSDGTERAIPRSERLPACP